MLNNVQSKTLRHAALHTLMQKENLLFVQLIILQHYENKKKMEN